MKTAILVPARLASTRLHEKMLHGIHGKPVLQWVAERIRDEVPEIPLYFAVDDQRIREMLTGIGFVRPRGVISCSSMARKSLACI